MVRSQKAQLFWRKGIHRLLWSVVASAWRESTINVGLCHAYFFLAENCRKTYFFWVEKDPTDNDIFWLPNHCVSQQWQLTYVTRHFCERKEVKKHNGFEETATTDYYRLWLPRHGLSQQQKLAHVMPFLWAKRSKQAQLFWRRGIHRLLWSVFASAWRESTTKVGLCHAYFFFGRKLSKNSFLSRKGSHR